ncbi:hypothetical protein JYU34_021600 [Plutella xylostella]|uniref:Cullin N-terminal domain-containing protein n=1 Tax=Plutella xylostella TaxID=51655 RepID=A0ABQ7PR28_PLUXY|nr:hypothetical protein JYU34_021600 [Plutella xylostella]
MKQRGVDESAESSLGGRWSHWRALEVELRSRPRRPLAAALFLGSCHGANTRRSGAIGPSGRGRTADFLMMSLKPRNVDFQETWAGLKETVAGVVGLQAVARGDWSACFSAVYSLCVAHPEPLAARLYDETRRFLEEHVAALLLRVRGDADERSHDFEDGLLTRYVVAWREYSQGAAYLNSLYSYLNLQHVKRQKK